MRFLIHCSLVAVLVLLSGCCASSYGTANIDCNNSLQCDLQRFLCIDEFTMEYWRNTFNCPGGQDHSYSDFQYAPNQAQAATQTASQAASENVVHY